LSVLGRNEVILLTSDSDSSDDDDEEDKENDATPALSKSERFPASVANVEPRQCLSDFLSVSRIASVEHWIESSPFR
jgi:hypothetical protein